MPNRPCHRENPARHKMAILTFFGLLIPVYIIPGALAALLPRNPILVTVLAVGLIVMLMMYVIMPLLTRVFKGWLTDSNKPAA